MVARNKQMKFIVLNDSEALEKLPCDLEMNLQVPIKFVKFVPEAKVLQIKTSLNYRDMPEKNVWMFINDIPKEKADLLVNRIIALEKMKKEGNLTSQICISVKNTMKRTQVWSGIPFNLRMKMPKKATKLPEISFADIPVVNFEKARNQDQLSLFESYDIRRN